ncbi:MAG: TIGR00269 family protein [Thaumarchaeota archaeon]|nr:TIGR00269 family protein [Nitrososphaerota archaeon]
MTTGRQKCGFCGGESVYHRLYSGEQLCRSCFRDSLEEKTRRTISQYKMLKHGDTVAVAVSGGKDSLSLLDILSKLTQAHGEKIVAVTVDEGIEGYRGEAVELARSEAAKRDVPFHVVSFESLFGFTLNRALDAWPDRSISACTVCGILRRRAIDLAAEQVGATVVATAHNLDDFLQTYFINLTSGDVGRLEFLYPGLEPSIGLPRRVKPFVEIYEEEIAFYAFLSGIPFQTEPCPYMDEGVRTEIREFLNRLERRHPGVKHSTYKTAMKMLSGRGEEKSSDRRSVRCNRCGRPASDKLCSVCRIIETIQNNRSSKL